MRFPYKDKIISLVARRLTEARAGEAEINAQPTAVSSLEECVDTKISIPPERYSDMAMYEKYIADAISSRGKGIGFIDPETKGNIWASSIEGSVTISIKKDGFEKTYYGHFMGTDNHGLQYVEVRKDGVVITVGSENITRGYILSTGKLEDTKPEVWEGYEKEQERLFQLVYEELKRRKPQDIQANFETTIFHSSVMSGQSGICCAQKP